MIKIHIHSDNSQFGGSENMLSSILNSKLINRSYDISFSYRNSKLYQNQFQEKMLKKNIPVYPLLIPEWQYFSKFMKFNPRLISNMFRILLMPIFFIPAAIYEIILFHSYLHWALKILNKSLK